jgi:twinkle protein
MRTHLPCPTCGSSDALTDYGDHTYCFSCGKTSGGPDPGEASGSLVSLADLGYQPIVARKLSAETCRKFNYGCTNGQQVACYFDADGTLVYQKTRDKDKNFRVLKGDLVGTPMKHLLFGRNLWGDLGGQKLLITEGEIDCLSAYEALGSLGFHVVSVPCGAQGALDAIKFNLDWIDRYQAVYLGFDNDDAGRKATSDVCQSVGSSKFYQMNMPPDLKDINDLWVARGRTGVLDAYQEARAWRPRGIIDPKSYYGILTETPKRGISWPIPTLNKTTYGINPGLIFITAGSGIGKTTLFKQLEAHVYTQGYKIGIIHLEEPARGTLNGLMSLIHGKPFHTPDSMVTDAERLAAATQLAAEDRLILYDKQIGFDEDLILSHIRYMVQGLGCAVVFLDHITAIVDQYDRDINQKTRNLIVKLGKLVTSLEFPLFVISHLRKADGKPHEEGGRVHLDDLLGAGALKQWAEHVFALERDNQHEDPKLRNRPFLRDLKNRPLGEYTGTTIPLEYDPETFTLKEVEAYEPGRSASSEPLDF